MSLISVIIDLPRINEPVHRTQATPTPRNLPWRPLSYKSMQTTLQQL